MLEEFLSWRRVRLLLRVVLPGAYGYAVCGLSPSWGLLKYIIKDAQKYGKSPWPPFAGRGEMATAMVSDAVPFFEQL